MSGLIKPRLPVINWGHSLSKKLIFDEEMYVRGGTTTIDLASKLKGTFGNSGSSNPTWDNDIYGQCVKFAPGSGSAKYQYIDYGTPSVLSLNRNFTIMSLFKYNIITADTNDCIISHGDNDWYFRVNTSAQLEFLDSQQASILSGSTAIGANVWTTGAVTVTNASTATVTLYLNGKSDGSTTTSRSFTDGSMSVQIGCDQNIGAGEQESFDGKITYVRIWNRVLSASEIMSLHNNPWQIYTKPRL